MSAKREQSIRTRHNSTFAVEIPTAADRIAAMPHRSVELARTTPMKKANAKNVAKRDKEYQRKLAAYRRSETHAIVERRSHGVCEAAVGRSMLRERDVRLPQVDWSAGYIRWSNVVGTWNRCRNRAMDHHHIRYARLGGNELPTDILHVCKACHEALEAAKPVRRSRRSS